MKGMMLLVLVHLTLLAQAQNYGFDWAKKLSSDYTSCTDVKTDPAGNIYAIGSFLMTADLDPGADTSSVTSNGGYDMFIVKLTPDGAFIWGKTIGGTGNDVLRQIEFDADGNLYFAGSFSTTVDFDPDTSVANVTATGTIDMCFFKMDSDGNFQWVKAMGSTGDDQVQAMDIKNNQLYIAGAFGGNMDFDPGSGVAMVNSTTQNFNSYIAKYNLNGDLTWVYKIICNTALNLYDISTDANGNVYAGGNLKGTATFGTFSDSTFYSSEQMAFVTKLSTNGDFSWVRTLTGASSTTDESYCYALSAKNDYLLFGGRLTGSVDVDPGTATSILYGPNGYICKMNGNGDLVWSSWVAYTSGIYSIVTDGNENLYYTGYNELGSNQYSCAVGKLNSSGVALMNKQIGGFSLTVGYRIALTPNNELVTVGKFDSTIDFNPGPGVFLMTPSGQYNGFIQKFNECVPVTGTDTRTACGQYTWINGVTYTESTTAVTILPNVNGCDSTITLNLTILPQSTSTFTHTACSSYTWINGVTYYSSNNTAQYVLTNSAGCDSVITLNLTILQPDATIANYTDGVLIASEGDTYQWMNCDDHTLIAGATSGTFTPAENGNYAVIVSTADCSDTSDCFAVNDLGLSESGNLLSIQIAPNPSTTGLFSVTTPTVYSQLEVTVYTVDGRKLLHKTYAHSHTFDLEIDEADGVYILEVIANTHSKSTYRLVKQ